MLLWRAMGELAPEIWAPESWSLLSWKTDPSVMRMGELVLRPAIALGNLLSPPLATATEMLALNLEELTRPVNLCVGGLA